MGQPHKHAELIKAWADGAEIEYYSVDRWVSVPTPLWYDECKYRIKPQTKKFRLYLYELSNGVTVVRVCNFGTKEEHITEMLHFVKWLGDWQEVEI